MLLDQAEAEINSVKQKFDHDLKQEKQKLRQKLITKRRREMLQKVIYFQYIYFHRAYQELKMESVEKYSS